VIGATGLLGRPVAAGLHQSGFEVHGAARRIDSSRYSHRLDLTDLGETKRVLQEVKPDAVVQMTGGPAGDPAELTRINLVPTINLIHAAAGIEEPPSIFVSGSAAEYGDPGEERASETATPRPLSPYGWVKAVETATARELGRLHELNLTVVRPFNPVTPLLPQATALGNFRRQLLQGVDRKRRILCGRIDVVRDFISATFIGEVMCELVDRPPGGIVNICSGTGIRLDQVMLAAAEILDVDLEFIEDETLSKLPAPDAIVGDPTHLNSLVRVRADSTPASLASELLRTSVDTG
jgi:nucleoside-diphosphate-sugar epimerase